MLALRPLVLGTWLFTASLAAQEHTHAMDAAAHGDHAAALRPDDNPHDPAPPGSQAAPADPPPTAQEAAPVTPIDHAQMSHAEMDHGALHDAQIKHAQMEHGQMEHAAMEHAAMDHHAMGHGAHTAARPASPASPALPREPIPAVSDAEIAAAFAPLQAHAMHGMGINHYILLDRLEAVDTDRGSGQDWEARAWIGGDIDRLWLRSEGERVDGRTQSATLEAFYGHAISPWWDVLIGARQDLASEDRRSWAAIGVQGLAPYKFETEATLYLGSAGRAALRLEGEYDVLLTNRLILQPRVEADIALTDDDRRGIGSGLEQVQAGLRLRYEFTRRFAPYIGWVHTRRFGDAARNAMADQQGRRDSQVVAGIRIWF